MSNVMVSSAGLIALLTTATFVANGQTASSCKPSALQTDSTLTLKQQGCYYAREFLSPQRALIVSVASIVDRYSSAPNFKGEHWGQFPRHLGVYYVRNTARSTSELFVGYLHHEDPRFRPSKETAFFRRTNSALLNVLTSPDTDGHLRPAFAPIAGSFSSAAAGSAFSRRDQTPESVCMRAGITYGFYFARAIFNEFKPDIAKLFHH